MRHVRLAWVVGIAAASIVASAIGCSGGEASVPATADAGAAEDAAPAVDATIDGAGENDGAPSVDAGSDAPTWVPPHAPSDACSSTQLDTLFTDCVHPTYDRAKCHQDHLAMPGCFDCVFTPANSASYGAIVEYANDVYANYAGCLAIELGDAGAGCAAAEGTYDDCLRSACDHCYGIDAGALEGGVVAANAACVAAARGDGGACASYRATAIGSCPTHSPAYAACSQPAGATWPQWTRGLAELFCEAAADAGMDASDGGP